MRDFVDQQPIVSYSSLTGPFKIAGQRTPLSCVIDRITEAGIPTVTILDFFSCITPYENFARKWNCEFEQRWQVKIKVTASRPADPPTLAATATVWLSIPATAAAAGEKTESRTVAATAGIVVGNADASRAVFSALPALAAAAASGSVALR